ncbi:MAG: HEAT repeat domain-containing protein [Thermoguttaceae bacterium]|nr:HEAT repeat domain-containing protein [Thermoguttaceae bacterium]MDW8037561.1 HEAT repeat domain-containing protein [Thermoguttaceae bacterium]
MASGLEATFQYLARTDNPVAVELLDAALDCPYGPVRQLALAALLAKPNRAIHRRLFARLGEFDSACKAILAKRADRLVSVVSEIFSQVCQHSHKNSGLDCRKKQEEHATIKSATLDKTLRQDFLQACEAVREFCLYEALPGLIQAVEAAPEDLAVIGAGTVLELTKAFYGELSAGQNSARDVKTLRTRLTEALQAAASSYSRHRRRELLEAFLILAKPQDPLLRRILHDRRDSVHEELVRLLAESTEGGVIRLLLGFLEDPLAPQAALEVLAQRTDARFVQIWAHQAGYPPPEVWRETLSRVRRVAWAEPAHPLWSQLDGQAQAGAIGLLVATKIDRCQLLEILEYLLHHGQPEGRRTAAAALAELAGAKADLLVVRLLQDADPYVQAEAIRQLRRRNISEALSKLVHLVDSAEPVVRQALQEAMPEFTCKNFLRTFEQLPEELRQTAGYLVRKIDSDSLPLLVAEMQSLSPLRRRRAVEVASAMGAIAELEPQIVLLLQDEDHRVRIAAARALADSRSQPTWKALHDALFDRSLLVQEEAEKSLQKIIAALAGQTESATPPTSANCPESVGSQ